MFCEMLSEPRGDDGVVVIKLPLLDLSKASANVLGKRTVDGHTGHAVGWMFETLEIGLGFAFSLEGSWIACFHVNADNVAHVVVHQVLKAAVAVLHTSLLNVVKKTGWGRFPAVLFLSHDTSCMVLTESFLGQGWVT